MQKAKKSDVVATFRLHSVQCKITLKSTGVSKAVEMNGCSWIGLCLNTG